MIKKLIKWQKEKCLTDAELARVLGYDASMISYLRSGKRKMGIEKAKNLPIITNNYITKEDIYNYY